MTSTRPDAERSTQERSEEEQERLNRQMLELLNELRVAMPGVQVLFGFLLTVPFQQGWRRVTEFQENEKPKIVHAGTVEMVAGLVALAVAMNAAVLLVTDVVFDSGTTVVTVVGLAMLYVTLWFGFGLLRRVR